MEGVELKYNVDYLITGSGQIINKKINRILKLKRNKLGYKTILINKKRYRIDILVAEHFLPNPENKPHIKHKNNCPQDNNVDNLEWVDSSNINEYTRISKNKTHDYKNISYYKRKDRYTYKKTINGKTYEKQFKNLKDALCYKYIFILKMRAGLV
jgi:hypothetical protein